MSMLTEFKETIIKHGNIARTNRFKVDFSGLVNKDYATNEEIRDLEYFLEDVNIPSKDIETVDYSLYRNPIAYATGYKNGDFSMKFRAPTDMFVKTIFDAWIEDIIPRENYLLKYRSEIGVDFKIKQISDRKNDRYSIYSITIMDCYPISIGSIEYSNTQNDEYVTFTVNFAYRDIKYLPDGEVTVLSPILFNGDIVPRNNNLV